MIERLPDWIKTRRHPGLLETEHLLRRHRLSTVCEDARCPNRGDCFSRPVAAFLILGPHCTRSCGFCSVSHAAPVEVRADEPEQVAAAAGEMKLTHVVITSVTRDDLPDGGAAQFARTIRAVRARLPGSTVEVLTPDFGGDRDALDLVLDAGPDVFNHNMETVERLYPAVRGQASYRQSLSLLRHAMEKAPSIARKSGFMLGLGETGSEVDRLLADLRDAGCDMLTVGQYLRPTRKNLPVVNYIPPHEFGLLRERAYGMGFRYVAADPLVRSSMNAAEMYDALRGAK